jgi:hypothetical protein
VTGILLRVDRDLQRSSITPDSQIDIIAGNDRREAASTFARENRLAVDVRDYIAALENSV